MFGIYIGNTNASIALCKENGEAVLLTNDSGDRQMPVFVAITEKGVNVGRTGELSNSSTVITSNKSLMSKNNPNCQHFHSNIEIQEQDDSSKTNYFSPERIAVYIFKELLITAKSASCVDKSTLSCVLLVPGSFVDDYCEKYKQAAEAAGWEVLQIIHESAAAVLAYSLLDNKYEPPQNVVVYRLGGMTCEVTVCEISDGMVSNLGTTYREDIGGNLFVDVVANFLSDEFFRKYKLDPREKRRSFEKLKQTALNCIQVLSNLQTVNCFIESLYEGIDFSVSFSRARFDMIIKPLVEKCVEPLKLLVNDLNMNNAIDKIILCGGVTNNTTIKQVISSIFYDCPAQILSYINPQEVLAIGGAKQAYYLHINNCLDYLPRSMDINT